MRQHLLFLVPGCVHGILPIVPTFVVGLSRRANSHSDPNAADKGTRRSERFSGRGPEFSTIGVQIRRDSRGFVRQMSKNSAAVGPWASELGSAHTELGSAHAEPGSVHAETGECARRNGH
jgi:hypothetical protein